MFNINDFRASIDQQGVIKSNKFLMTIPKPKVVDEDLGNLLTLRCESVTLPGVDLASSDGPPRFGYGPQQRHPYNATFTDIQATFLIDTKTTIHKFFYKWVNGIVNFNSRGGKEMSTVMSHNMRPYESAYKDDYSVTLTVDVYADDGEKKYTVKAYQAFPMSLPNETLAWSEDGELLRMRIPFAYTDYEILKPKHETKSGPEEKSEKPISKSQSAGHKGSTAEFYRNDKYPNTSIT